MNKLTMIKETRDKMLAEGADPNSRQVMILEMLFEELLSMTLAERDKLVENEAFLKDLLRIKEGK